MTDVTSDTEAGRAAVSGTGAVDDGLVAELVTRAQAGGVKLTGEGGLRQQLTKRCWSPRWRASSLITWAMSAKGLTHGEISAHLAEVTGACCGSSPGRPRPSPPTRGCSEPREPLRGAGGVLPADAGALQSSAAPRGARSCSSPKRKGSAIRVGGRRPGRALPGQ